MKSIKKHIVGWILILGFCYSTSCSSTTEDPQVQKAHEKLSEVLSLISVRSLNKDSILTKAKNMNSDEIGDLVNNLESRFGEEIAESRASRERKDKIKAQFDLREGFHIKTKYAVQQSMDNPDSFVHEGTTHVDKGDTIYVTMRFKMRDPAGAIKSYLIESKVDIEGNVLVGDISMVDN